MYAIEKKHDGYHVYANGGIRRIYRSEDDAKQWVNQMKDWMESSDRTKRSKMGDKLRRVS